MITRAVDEFIRLREGLPVPQGFDPRGRTEDQLRGTCVTEKCHGMPVDVPKSKRSGSGYIVRCNRCLKEWQTERVFLGRVDGGEAMAPALETGYGRAQKLLRVIYEQPRECDEPYWLFARVCMALQIEGFSYRSAAQYGRLMWRGEKPAKILPAIDAMTLDVEGIWPKCAKQFSHYEVRNAMTGRMLKRWPGIVEVYRRRLSETAVKTVI